jgi:putative SOS response-associated peptidase YedK
MFARCWRISRADHRDFAVVGIWRDRKQQRQDPKQIGKMTYLELMGKLMGTKQKRHARGVFA